VLSIDPSSRGFGFAILEGPTMLVDWGVRTAKKNKRERSLRLIDDLITRYEPDTIVIEDYSRKGSRRCARIGDLIDGILKFASRKKIRAVTLSRLKIRKVFSEASANKHQIAVAIARQFPELAPRLPPPRKPWMSEDYRMSIFDAAALGIAFFKFKDKKKMGT
jgi:Holliday junction resolvasome RuvABC endonuclease subunit